MIRINLLGTERRPAVRKAFSFDIAQRMTAAAVVVVAAGVTVVAWWFWSLHTASARVDAELAAARQEETRLRSLLAEVQKFEAQRTMVQERVALIERLRSGQSVPVQLLDHISRSLPDMLWLTTLRQAGDEVTIQGHSTTLIALSDFVGSLGSNQIFQRPIEIVNSQVQPPSGAGADAVPELILFTVRARIHRPESVQASAEPPAGRGARGRGARAARGGRGGAR